MSWCPKCCGEYRDGFAKCNDCGTTLINKLVDKPKDKNKTESNYFNEEVLLVNILDTVELSYVTSILEEEKITYRIMAGDIGQYLQIIHGRSFFGKSIYVGRECYDKAFEIVKSYKAETLPEDELDKSDNDHICGKSTKFIIWGQLILGSIVGAI